MTGWEVEQGVRRLGVGLDALQARLVTPGRGGRARGAVHDPAAVAGLVEQHVDCGRLLMVRAGDSHSFDEVRMMAVRSESGEERTQVFQHGDQ